MIRVEALVTGLYEVNTYLLINDAKEAFVVDPGYDALDIIDAIDTLGLTLKGILLTHGHADHIGALDDIRKKFDVSVYMNSKDSCWAFSSVNSLPGYEKVQEFPADNLVFVKDGEEIQLGEDKLKVLETPGHTPGCVCYIDDGSKQIFTGDTLFMRSIGRTDFPGGNMADMMASLKKLLSLDDSYVVYPGHGDSTTIGDERKYNSYCRGL